MTYAAMDIARYVINYCIDIGNPISNLKLQKILYYIQAAFLVEKEKACFDEEIVNWRHGPVIEDVYHEYKVFSDNDICERQNEFIEFIFNNDFSVDQNIRRFDEIKIDILDENLIQKVIDALIDFDAWELVRRTHEEEPWELTSNGDVISKELIKSYFGKSSINRRRIYGR